MKKSLVALAVLAASGAALAQVSITGNLTAGFQQTQVPSELDNAGIASGFGVDTAEVVFSASEDLGGGMKASAKLGLVDAARGMNRAQGSNIGFGPGDSELALSGSFGKVALSTSRGADYLSGGVAGVGGTFMDGRVLSDRVSRDSVAYSMPYGPVTVGVTYSEAPNSLGLGAGSSGNPAPALSVLVFPARQVALAVQYSDGPLAADVGYLTNDKIDTADGYTNLENKNHLRGSVSYDLGVVKLGAGMESQTWEGNFGIDPFKVSLTDTLLAVSVPLGATTLSANWAQREVKLEDTSILNVGYGLSAKYALSKRTSFIADYTAYTGAAGNSAANNNREMTTVYNLFLSHSF